jgi:serine/threonine-protein kinase
MTVPGIRENETVAGKYRIGRTLGEGGMGVVVAARHLELDQMVAIKFLRPEIAQQHSAAERFRREARAAARIRSPHICRVLDVGSLESGIPYLVMEYLEGCDLSDELAKRGRIPVPEALDYMLQACEALSEAHAVGIVHRDLKPGNLFLETRSDGSRNVKVLDFGVSKSVLDSAAQLKLTKTASLIGSPLYMSPEQLDAATDVDARVDIWALGTILYELIAGRTPFLADTIPQLVNAVVNGTHPSFQALGVSAPLGLENVIGRALSKRREDRFPSITEFSQSLLPFAASYGAVSISRRLSLGGSGLVAAGTASSGAASMDPGLVASRTLEASRGFPSGTPASWHRTSVPKKANHRAVLLGLALVPVIAAAVLFVLLSSERSAPPEPAPTHLATTPPEPSPPTPPEIVPAAAEPTPSAVVEPAAAVVEPAAVTAPDRPESKKSKTSPVRTTAARSPAAETSANKPEIPVLKAESPGDPVSDFGGRR